MASTWYMDILPIIFTRIKAKFSKSIMEKYNMTSNNFSTMESENTEAVFPAVYIELLPGTENAQDLERTDVNGGLFGFQIQVTDNQSRNRTTEVMAEIISIMKTMMFRISAMPVYDDSERSRHRATARFTRMIDKNDVI